MNLFNYFLIALCAYLLGSVNFGIIVSKLVFKTDVRALGSGNAGTTNILRNFGKTAAAAVFAGDALKGVIAVLAAKCVAKTSEELKYAFFVAAFFAIIGHLFPVYFKFKGGKGVATSLGVTLAIEPIAGLSLLLVFLLVVMISKRISLGSVCAAFCYPIATYFYVVSVCGEMLMENVIFSAIIGLLIIYMHKGNIKRLIKGEESKISFGKKDKSDLK